MKLILAAILLCLLVIPAAAQVEEPQKINVFEVVKKIINAVGDFIMRAFDRVFKFNETEAELSDWE
ncbi:MAG: hypothetical protein ABH829_04105 [archaeon]